MKNIGQTMFKTGLILLTLSLLAFLLVLLVLIPILLFKLHLVAGLVGLPVFIALTLMGIGWLVTQVRDEDIQ